MAPSAGADEELADMRLKSAPEAGTFDKLIDQSDEDRKAGRSRPLPICYLESAKCGFDFLSEHRATPEPEIQ